MAKCWWRKTTFQISSVRPSWVASLGNLGRRVKLGCKSRQRKPSGRWTKSLALTGGLTLVHTCVFFKYPENVGRKRLWLLNVDAHYFDCLFSNYIRNMLCIFLCFFLWKYFSIKFLFIHCVVVYAATSWLIVCHFANNRASLTVRWDSEVSPLCGTVLLK
jgi:hypothetical protein